MKRQANQLESFCRSSISPLRLRLLRRPMLRPALDRRINGARESFPAIGAQLNVFFGRLSFGHKTSMQE
jgi:hypothetical protein